MGQRGGEPPVVLYFGNDWFAENRTSSHQIARWLAKRYRVYYIECPGLRAPKASGRDLRKIWNKLWKFFKGGTEVSERLEVRTLLQLPLHRFALVRWLNKVVMLTTLRLLLWRNGVRRPVCWFLLPHLPAVVGALGERLSVYYCIDDYAALPDVNVDAVAAMDAETTRKADLVFVASDTLLEAKRKLNPAARVSPHGVDFDHFAAAQDDGLSIPADVADLSGPVVGFFGLIESWIDLDLIDYLAERRPHWTFVMVGRVAVPEDRVPRRPNVHFLGKRPYDELPAYAKRFDAAVIPYRLTRQVLHSNPIKLREYLATGKPVVSVSTPEIDKYADVVEVARSPEEFLAKLDDVLSRPPSAEEVRRRMDRVAAESWDARLREVIRVIEDRLAVGTPPPPSPACIDEVFAGAGPGVQRDDHCKVDV
jgi:glycosyltransferase involved in cell wall biosynthesis